MNELNGCMYVNGMGWVVQNTCFLWLLSFSFAFAFACFGYSYNQMISLLWFLICSNDLVFHLSTAILNNAVYIGLQLSTQTISRVVVGSWVTLMFCLALKCELLLSLAQPKREKKIPSHPPYTKGYSLLASFSFLGSQKARVICWLVHILCFVLHPSAHSLMTLMASPSQNQHANIGLYKNVTP